MDDRLGQQLAAGSRSTVFEWGAGAVAKVPRRSTPDAWIVDEARFTDAVYAIGAPAPRVLGLEVVAGRRVGIYERVDGDSMWDHVRAAPRSAVSLATELAAVQAGLLALGAPPGLPRLADRLVSKVRRAAAHHGVDLLAAIGTAPITAGRRVCHGDLHPGNVILGPHGPVVIDWFDAARGVPAADVARSVTLLSTACHGPSGVRHLPGSGADALDEFRTAYLDAVTTRLGIDAAEVGRWMPVVGVARLAEGVEPDGLLGQWRARRDHTLV